MDLFSFMATEITKKCTKTIGEYRKEAKWRKHKFSDRSDIVSVVLTHQLREKYLLQEQSLCAEKKVIFSSMHCIHIGLKTTYSTESHWSDQHFLLGFFQKITYTSVQI